MPGLHALELITFGAPTARVEGGVPAPDVLWRKNLALLAYLALSPDQTRTRDHLIGLLWPEKTEGRARHSLNEAVRRLRASLGPERLRSTGETLTLSDAALVVDALEFERVAATDRDRALALLRGEFLEGFTLDDAPAFESWLTDQRERFGHRGATMLIEHAEEALAQSRHGEAVDAARRAATSRPFSEPAVSLLMRAQALGGDAAGALRTFTEFGDRLRRELSEAPSRELDALAERIRTRRWRRVPAPHTEPEPALVGRPALHQRVFGLLQDAMAGGSRILAITGDPGMGRTRLLAECAARWTLQGGVVVGAHPLESDHDAPWSTLRAMGRGGLSGAAGVAGTDPGQLALLAALVPEITSVVPDRQPQDTAQVSSALAALLQAIGEEQPLMIALDDAHFADPSTLEALYGALTQVADAPVALVLTALNSAEGAPRALVLLRGAIGRSMSGIAVRLDPLTDVEMEELVAGLATWCRDDDERNRLTRRVAFETGSSPFLALTLLRGLRHAVTLRDDIVNWPRRNHTLEAPLPISVPDLARMAIVANVSALPADTRELLAAASILHLAIDAALLAQLAETDVETVRDRLATLERHHLVVFEGDRYSFTAPLIAQVVRAEFLTSGKRRALRERAIAALAGREDLEARVLDVELRASVEPGMETAQAASRVAREAKGAGALRTARRALRAAERALRSTPEATGAWLESLRSELATF